MFFRFLLLALCGLIPLSAQSILPPPYGLGWGDPPGKLIQWAKSEKLDRTEFVAGKNPDELLLTIEAGGRDLPNGSEDRIEARYHASRLYEVKIDYLPQGKTVEKMREGFGKMRKALVERYGPLKKGHHQQTEKSQVATFSESYRFQATPGLSVTIVLTQVTDQLRHRGEATYSLIYRNEHILSLSE